jgi:flagellar hook-length control protein FliK
VRLPDTAQPLATPAEATPSAALTPSSGDAGHASAGHGNGSAGASTSTTTTDGPQATVPAPTAAFGQVLGMAGGATATASTAAQPAHPSQVVAQIAQQADLYRLPGNRGLRIQLHPEDLGGVEVTVRYNPTGGLELHVNVEHAATGALVQAGWSELREALATHGISPDRLVMSVSAPTGASSSGSQDSFGGARPDAGQSAAFNFAQSQSGQQRHDQGDARSAFGWSRSPLFDGSSAADTNPESAVRSAADAISRIDYRA